jgi:hypothetical protein
MLGIHLNFAKKYNIIVMSFIKVCNKQKYGIIVYLTLKSTIDIRIKYAIKMV